MTDRELMQQALDALDLHAKQYPHMVKGYTADAAEAIRTRLAQPEQEPISKQYLQVQEPVAWMYDFPNPDDPTEIIKDWVAFSLDEVKNCLGINVRPLYFEREKNA